MLERVRKLKFVVLESPYDTWSHPLTEKIFSRLMGLKLKGYGCEYPYGVLPVDTTDFIADHLIICEEEDGELQPIVSIKSVSLAQCRQHGLVFPALVLMRQAGATVHAETIEQIIQTADNHDLDLRYVGSWTIDPDHRGDKEWGDVLRELFTTIYVSFHHDRKSQTIAGGTLRFKVDKYIQWLGHQPLSRDGKALPTVRVQHLAGEENLFTHLQSFTFESRSVAKKWQALWNDRIVIPRDPVQIQARKKAA